MISCLLCPVFRPTAEPRLPTWPPACEGCRDRARRELSEIPDAYALLPAALIPGRGHGERVSGSRVPPIPLDVEVVSLLGPGAAHLTGQAPVSDQVGEWPTALLLDQWARDWVDVRGQRERLPAPTVTTLVQWLLVRLDWALDEHPAVDEFVREVNQALRTMRGVARAGDYRGEPAGRCPMQLRDESRCGTQLRVDPYVDRITCSRCGSVWPRARWLALAAAQDEVTWQENGAA